MKEREVSLGDSACRFCASSNEPSAPHEKVALRSDLPGTATYVAPDIAPLGRVHFLISTKRHYTSFAEYAADEEWSRLWSRVTDLAERVTSFGAPTLFEHGSPFPFIPEVSGKCDRSEHAHLHMFDRHFEFETLLAALRARGFREQILRPDEAPSRQPLSYLLISDMNQIFHFSVDSPLERSYLRRLIVEISATLPNTLADGDEMPLLLDEFTKTRWQRSAAVINHMSTAWRELAQ